MNPSSKNASPNHTPRTPRTPTPQASGRESPGAQTPPSSTSAIETESSVEPKGQEPPLDFPLLRPRLLATNLVHFHIGPAPQDVQQAPLPHMQPHMQPYPQLPSGIAPEFMRFFAEQTSPAQTLQVPEVRNSIEAAELGQADAIVPHVDSLLSGWPQASEAAEQDLVQHTVATIVVTQPFFWEGLPHDLQQLVISALFGHADELDTEQVAQAAQMQQCFAHLLHTNRNMCELVLPHRDRVLFCALRLAPMSQRQLLGTPLHRLLGHGEGPQGAGYPLIHMLQALACAIVRLPTDELACHAALVLGRRLLEQLRSPHATAQDRRTLLLVPILLVQALRHRLHRPSAPNKTIGAALSQLTSWAGTLEPGLALPLLAELRYTLTQLEVCEQSERIQAFDLSQLSDRVDSLIWRKCGTSRQLNTSAAVDLLAQHVPDPWTPGRNMGITPYEFTQDLIFLADYPHAFVGFANEAFASLKKHQHELQLDEQQTELLQRCDARAQKPLDRPRPPDDH